MIQEFSYSFSDLKINTVEIARLLGYPDGQLPEPFAEYVDEAIHKADDLCEIRGAAYHSTNLYFSEQKDRIVIDGTEFKIGKTVARELRNSELVVLVICTAGEKISEYSHQMLRGENPVLGYVYDVLGSVVADSASEKIHREIGNQVAAGGLLVTNRYSPGYCQWSVADQHKLFSFFPEKCCGISLTSSALMNPVKSVSSMFGLGKNVKFRTYTCDLCSLTECFYRNRQKLK